MRRAWIALLLLNACGASEASPSPSERAVLDVKRYVDGRVEALHAACEALCGAAPEPDADGWSVDRDRAAVETMRARWRVARREYERVEGAIAILFPDLDQSVDGRYEHVVELRRDEVLFDGQGFVGMHAIERILWSDRPSPAVEAFERALPGYLAPRTPASADEARQFRDGLCARLVRDVASMRSQLAPLALDAPTAWRGIQGSIEEQSEKVRLAATGQDESRYAEHTLADMRANLEGGRAVLTAYAPMLGERATALGARLDELERAYAALPGDALPPVPDAFDPDAPSNEHLATPYGRLFTLLARASDPEQPGSLAHELQRAGLAMGIAPLSR